MIKKYLWLVIAVITMIFILIGCGSTNGSSDGIESSISESVIEESVDNNTKDNNATQEKALKWLTYDISLEELRDMNDSDNFSVSDPPSGSRYVVTKFVSTSGEIRADEITQDNTKSFILKNSEGEEYTPYLLSMWGVEFDDTYGFSTKEMQEGFNLLYIVPESIELTDLSFEMK